ncbi:YbfB/YjiJ family MFS transporter [Massilia sp. TWR1-2-2]|uniref:YbfB/YjiJ family MFS transporter n=1 Tax=Massilia sp. TWR1-2-2 TaxID=2804584 RepID=UPI003CF56FCB
MAGGAAHPREAWPGLCGMAATLTGVGIGRFAYVAILPLLVQQAWCSRTAAGYLGAANLAGYFLGIGIAAWLSRRCSAGRMVQASMLLCALSFFSCAWQGGGLAWFLCCRTVAGACGAILMVQAPVLILPRTDAARRGRVGGVIFSGVGLGIVAAATVVPSLVRHGLAATWLTLGGICLLLTISTWRYWQQAPAQRAAPAGPWRLAWPRFPAPVALLLAAYALNAVGYLPHTLFWADYITGELQRPLAEAGFFWACFGAGAACGPYLTGVIADRIGLTATLFIAFSLKAAGVALPLFADGAVALLVSLVLVGFFSPGIVGAASGYALEIGGADNHRRYWTAMNFGFSLAQAGAASAMVWLMGARLSYALLFVISSSALAISALCIGAIALLRQRDAQLMLRA